MLSRRLDQLNRIRSELQSQYPVPVTGMEKKLQLKRLANELRQLKQEMRRTRREGNSAFLVDSKYRCLKFAAWVLNVNVLQNKGWKAGGWLNGREKCASLVL